MCGLVLLRDSAHKARQEGAVINMRNKWVWERDGFLMRLASAEDAEAYYHQNYAPLDREVARMTGCKVSMLEDEWRQLVRLST